MSNEYSIPFHHEQSSGKQLHPADIFDVSRGSADAIFADVFTTTSPAVTMHTRSDNNLDLASIFNEQVSYLEQDEAFERMSKCLPPTINLTKSDHALTAEQVGFPIRPDEFRMDSGIGGKPFIGNVNGTSQVSPNQIKDYFDKGKKQKALTEIAAYLFESDDYRVLQTQLAHYAGPHWEYITSNTDFITMLKNHHPEMRQTWDLLSSHDYKELHLKMLTTPEYQIDSSDMGDNPIHIFFNDSMYNIETRRFEEIPKTQMVFSYINLSKRSINQTGGTIVEQYLDSCSGGNLDLKTRMKEIIGSCLYPGQFKGFHLLLGKSNTGKSVFANMIADIFGEGRYCGINGLNDLAGKWTMAMIIKTKLCICAELPDSKISKASALALKLAVGDDVINYEEKYSPLVSARCDARFVVASNFMLDLKSIDDEAFENRLNITPFVNPVPKDKAIPNLRRELSDDNVQGYIIWAAIQAMHDWIDKGHIFTDVPIPSHLLNNTGSKTTYIQEFIDNICETGSDKDHTLIQTFYDAYLTYWKHKPEAHASFIDFSRRFHDLVPPEWERKVFSKSVAGKQARGLVGVRLRNTFSYNTIYDT